MRKTWVGTVLLGLLSASGLHAVPESSPADIPPRDTMTFDMQEVVVTATRTPLTLKEAPVLTRIITARDLEKRGAGTLQQALENELAGVEFHQTGYGSSISFQGLDARYVLFLIDGERIAGETSGNIDYNRIPLQNIERIEIIRGAASVLYGSNAMGAVVNIITRMPQKRFELSASARYGTPYGRNRSVDTLANSSNHTPTDRDNDYFRRRIDLPNFKGDFSAGFRAGRFKSLTALSYRTADAYKLTGKKDETRHYRAGELINMTPKMIPITGPGGAVVGMRPEMDEATGMPVFVEGSRNVNDTTVVVPPDARGLGVSGYRDLNLSQRFEYEPSEKFRFELSGSYFNKRNFNFQSSLLDDNPMSGTIIAPWSYESYEGYNLRALMEHTPGDRNKIYLSFWRDEYFRDRDSLSGVSTPKQNHTYNIPRLLWTLDAGRNHRLTTGLEVVGEQLHFDMNPAGYDNRKKMTAGSLYVQDELFSGRRVSFTLGARADYNDRFGWHATPKASVKYSPGRFSLRANYANGYRNPTLKELYMEFEVPVLGETYIQGNPDLNPETNHYVSLSGEYTTDGFNASATLYSSFFRNKIDVRGHSEGARTILQYQNIDRSELAGIELMARLRVARGLFLKANYNYIHQQDNAPEESTQYIYPSPHTATLQGDWNTSLGRGYSLGINTTLRYVGPKNYEDFMPVIEMSGPMSGWKYWTGSYSARHDGYLLWNAAVNLYYQRTLNLTLGVDNITDYKAPVVNFNSCIAPGRNFFVRLAWFFEAD